jgi:MFS family permease
MPRVAEDGAGDQVGRLDVTIVVVTQPAIQDGLHASFTDVQWVLDAYALTLASLLLTAGVLADRYGRKLLFQIGLVIFTLGSLTSYVPAARSRRAPRPRWRRRARAARARPVRLKKGPQPDLRPQAAWAVARSAWARRACTARAGSSEP